MGRRRGTIVRTLSTTSRTTRRSSKKCVEPVDVVVVDPSQTNTEAKAVTVLTKTSTKTKNEIAKKNHTNLVLGETSRPQSERKNEDQEQNEKIDSCRIKVTPESKMKGLPASRLRQSTPKVDYDDFLLSQRASQEFDVGWRSNSPLCSNTSPGTVDISEVLQRCIESETRSEDDKDENRPKSPSLMSIWNAPSPSPRQENPSAQLNSRFGHGGRSRCGRVRVVHDAAKSRDMLLKLAAALETSSPPQASEKTGTTDDVSETNDSLPLRRSTRISAKSDSSEGSVIATDHSVTMALFSSESDMEEQPLNIVVTPKRVESDQVFDIPDNKETTREPETPKSHRQNKSVDELWTDDDFDDSFVNATQALCDASNFVSPKAVGPKRKMSIRTPDGPQSKSGRFSYTATHSPNYQPQKSPVNDKPEKLDWKIPAVPPQNTTVSVPKRPFQNIQRNIKSPPMKSTKESNSNLSATSSKNITFSTSASNIPSQKQAVPNVSPKPFARYTSTEMTNAVSAKDVHLSTRSQVAGPTTKTVRTSSLSTTSTSQPSKIHQQASSSSKISHPPTRPVWVKPYTSTTMVKSPTTSATTINTGSPLLVRSPTSSTTTVNTRNPLLVRSTTSSTTTINTRSPPMVKSPTPSTTTIAKASENVTVACSKPSPKLKSVISIIANETTPGKNTSFTDDILAALAEPDDILDSQMSLFDGTINEGPQKDDISELFHDEKNCREKSDAPVKSLPATVIQPEAVISTTASNKSPLNTTSVSVPAVHTHPPVSNTSTKGSSLKSAVSSCKDTSGQKARTERILVAAPVKPAASTNQADIDGLDDDDDLPEDELLAILDAAESQLSQEPKKDFKLDMSVISPNCGAVNLNITSFNPVIHSTQVIAPKDNNKPQSSSSTTIPPWKSKDTSVHGSKFVPNSCHSQVELKRGCNTGSMNVITQSKCVPVVTTSHNTKSTFIRPQNPVTSQQINNPQRKITTSSTGHSTGVKNTLSNKNMVRPCQTSSSNTSAKANTSINSLPPWKSKSVEKDLFSSVNTKQNTMFKEPVGNTIGTNNIAVNTQHTDKPSVPPALLHKVAPSAKPISVNTNVSNPAVLSKNSPKNSQSPTFDFNVLAQKPSKEPSSSGSSVSSTENKVLFRRYSSEEKLGSSQPTCSPDEIEKKRIEAIQKRRNKFKLKK